MLLALCHACGWPSTLLFSACDPKALNCTSNRPIRCTDAGARCTAGGDPCKASQHYTWASVSRLISTAHYAIESVDICSARVIYTTDRREAQANRGHVQDFQPTRVAGDRVRKATLPDAVSTGSTSVTKIRLRTHADLLSGPSSEYGTKRISVTTSCLTW